MTDLTDRARALLGHIKTLRLSGRDDGLVEDMQRAADEIERLTAELAAANAVIDELRADAERYRHLRQFTSAGRNTVGRQIFVLPYVSPAGLDLFHGSVAQHLDAAIDAARALRSRSKG